MVVAQVQCNSNGHTLWDIQTLSHNPDQPPFCLMQQVLRAQKLVHSWTESAADTTKHHFPSSARSITHLIIGTSQGKMCQQVMKYSKAWIRQAWSSRFTCWHAQPAPPAACRRLFPQSGRSCFASTAAVVACAQSRLALCCEQTSKFVESESVLEMEK